MWDEIKEHGVLIAVHALIGLGCAVNMGRNGTWIDYIIYPLIGAVIGLAVGVLTDHLRYK